MPIIGELYTMTINYGFMSNTTTYLLEKAVKSCEVLVSVASQPNESDDRKQTPGPKAVTGQRMAGPPCHSRLQLRLR